MIHHVNAAEPGDAELDDDACAMDRELHAYDAETYPHDEHVDGCGCDKCRAMWVDLDDGGFLLMEHNAMKHAVLVDDCPACDSYGVDEVRAPNDWDDVPF